VADVTKQRQRRESVRESFFGARQIYHMSCTKQKERGRENFSRTEYFASFRNRDLDFNTMSRSLRPHPPCKQLCTRSCSNKHTPAGGNTWLLRPVFVCNQNADQLGSLAGPSLLTVYVGVVECAPASLSPASSSLTHARRMDGFCNQNADQLGSLAGPSLLTVYVGVVECAPASPYTYSSTTHRFPDERTPIEATPLSATSAELGLGLGLGLGLDSLSHSSSHALPFFSPPSFHTLSLSPAFTSVWWSG
jgi:hypothetical protein